MAIAQRLQDVMNQVRPEVSIPIIVEVTADPNQAAPSLQGFGFSLGYVSKTLPLIYGSANSAAIQAIAAQPFVKEVSYNEPTYAL